MADVSGLQQEVLWKLGRNLLNCQLVEQSLKVLLRRSDFVVTMRTGEPLEGEFINGDPSGSTLGQLVGLFKRTVLGPSPEEDDNIDDANLSRVSFSFRVSISEAERAERLAAELDWLVCTRNELAHAFIENWHPGDPARLAETIRLLDEQNPRIAAMQSWLIHTLKNFKTAVDCLFQSEGNIALEMCFRGPLLVQLAELAACTDREDGWTDLSGAARKARGRLPDECSSMKERYGVSTFKRLLLANRTFFEVLDEPLPNGGSRTLYRMRPTVEADGAPAESGANSG